MVLKKSYPETPMPSATRRLFLVKTAPWTPAKTFYKKKQTEGFPKRLKQHPSFQFMSISIVVT
jgi:hypothetical protein